MWLRPLLRRFASGRRGRAARLPGRPREARCLGERHGGARGGTAGEHGGDQRSLRACGEWFIGLMRGRPPLALQPPTGLAVGLAAGRASLGRRRSGRYAGDRPAIRPIQCSRLTRPGGGSPVRAPGAHTIRRSNVRAHRSGRSAILREAGHAGGQAGTPASGVPHDQLGEQHPGQRRGAGSPRRGGLVGLGAREDRVGDRQQLPVGLAAGALAGQAGQRERLGRVAAAAWPPARPRRRARPPARARGRAGRARRCPRAGPRSSGAAPATIRASWPPAIARTAAGGWPGRAGRAQQHQGGEAAGAVGHVAGVEDAPGRHAASSARAGRPTCHQAVSKQRFGSSAAASREQAEVADPGVGEDERRLRVARARASTAASPRRGDAAAGVEEHDAAVLGGERRRARRRPDAAGRRRRCAGAA